MTEPRARQSVTPELLLRAYTVGIFPMAEGRNDPEIFWVDPRKRGVMPLDGFHISRSLGRRIIKAPYEITLNANFEGVLDGCADRPETWINGTIRSLYLDLHDMGRAHSIEVWKGNELIGGVYGVSIGTAFFRESMFSRATDASKIALAYLVDHLEQTGYTLFDTQFLTEHLKSLGGIEVSRDLYHDQLQIALDEDARFGTVALPDTQTLLQRMTQTS